jgi:hypothetical protein
MIYEKMKFHQYIAVIITALITLLVLLFDKMSSVQGSEEQNYNPQLVIENIQGFNVVRDDLLPGGTKQRATVELLEQLPYKEIIYVSPTTGFAQIALSLAARVTGKRAVIFMARERPMRPQTLTAKKLGGIIKEGKYMEKMASLRAKAEQYVAADPKNRTELYLGMDLPEFKDALTTSIMEAVAGTELADVDAVRTFWIVGGSAVLAKVLADIFSNSHFNVVQVGRAVKLPDNGRFTLHVAPEDFYADAVLQPPYPSVSTYDAKVWQFAKKLGHPGDYIWNVAGP